MIRRDFHHLRQTGVAIAFLVVCTVATSCRKTTQTQIELSSTGPQAVNTSGSMTARLDAACMTGNYDACIFLKNPIAQRGASLAGGVTNTSNLGALQTYGVPIKGLDNSGFLQNSSFRILPLDVPRVTRAADGTWRWPYSSCPTSGSCSLDAAHRVSQVMAYYWLGFQLEEMESKTGAYFARNRAIVVEPFANNYPNAHWDYVNNEIVMGEIAEQDLAISAEIYLHEAGHANLHYATMGAVNGASPNDAACGSGGFDRCCTTFTGCIGAIHEGQADYHMAMLFPGNTAMGETLDNDIRGFSECGITRSVSANVNLTASTAYQACGGSLRGEIHVTGRVYASIWFELRRAAGSNAGQIDTLFTEHLRTLAATDTFESAGTKMVATDNALFGGAHVGAIRAEFTRRGLTAP